MCLRDNFETRFVVLSKAGLLGEQRGAAPSWQGSDAKGCALLVVVLGSILAVVLPVALAVSSVCL